MELGDVIRRRRMCRNFSDEPVGPGVIEALIDQARRAPSAGHTQGWSFLALQGADQTARFWAADADPEWLAAPSLPGLVRAPAVVVPWCSEAAYRRRYREADKGDTARDWDVPYWLVDISFATMLLLLSAEEAALGALFFRLRPGAADRLRTEFGVPAEWSPIGAVALGYPAPRATGADPPPRGSAAQRPRLPLEEVLHLGGW